MDQPMDIEMDELLDDIIDEIIGGTLSLAALESLPAEIMDMVVGKAMLSSFFVGIR